MKFFTNSQEPRLKGSDIRARQDLMAAAYRALSVDTNTSPDRPFVYLLPPIYRPIPIPWKLPMERK